MKWVHYECYAAVFDGGFSLKNEWSNEWSWKNVLSFYLAVGYIFLCDMTYHDKPSRKTAHFIVG